MSKKKAGFVSAKRVKRVCSASGHTSVCSAICSLEAALRLLRTAGEMVEVDYILIAREITDALLSVGEARAYEIASHRLSEGQ